MAMDSIQAVRQAAIVRMVGFAPLTSIVPAASIYPQSAPAAPGWPFVKWGSFSSLPRRAACLDGALLVGAVHGFARARKSSASIAETGEDHASRLGTQIAKALDRWSTPIEGGVATFLWTGSQLLIDGNEADDFHAVVNFRIRCSTV
jgi:hypothetical protein